ncbi:hypothetical protein [Streptomyces kanamyceticus]|uniref:hypothetical protein n=1 Tax=Streptomyces kanamyceticus TaxID=1967 RepID=UPI00168D2EEE|nr:hypothetical protein [Streptomyces kanamyceticus]
MERLEALIWKLRDDRDATRARGTEGTGAGDADSLASASADDMFALLDEELGQS